MRPSEYLSVCYAYNMVRQDQEPSKRLTFAETAVLCKLALRDEPMRICDLADWQGVSHPTMTSRMRHLAGLGYVTRSEGDEDHRVVIYGISETGRENILTIVKGVHDRIPRKWPLARASTRMLARVIRAMGTVPCDAGDLILLAMTVQEYETVCLTDLAKGTGLMQPTISMAVQTLCNRGLVTMGKATEGDLRKKQISITDAWRERTTVLIHDIESVVIRRRGAIEPDESA